MTDYSYNYVTWHASSFDGRATVWSAKSESDYEQAVILPIKISEGQAKVVLVDGNGNVTTVVSAGG